MAAGPLRVPTPYDGYGVEVYEWTGLLNGEAGAPLVIAHFSDRTIQATGTFGAGGTVRIEGTASVALVPAGGDYGALRRANDGADADLTSSRPIVLLENPYQIRPSVVAGDGTTTLTVRVTCASRG